MERKKPKTIGIFVGYRDYASQNGLSRKRKEQGWARGELTTSRNIRRALRHTPDSIVMVNGADADCCVPWIVDEAIVRGARRVVVPLHQIKTGLEGLDALVTRARCLAHNLLSMGTPIDDRLIVTPTRVWNSALRHARKNAR